jgi:serine/threonine-protein kinase HipA
MIRLRVFCQGIPCGILKKTSIDETYCFTYDDHYIGPPISLTMPVQHRSFSYPDLPPFFEGLLPEYLALDEVLLDHKIDAENYLLQLAIIGKNLPGTVTLQPVQELI